MSMRDRVLGRNEALSYGKPGSRMRLPSAPPRGDLEGILESDRSGGNVGTNKHAAFVFPV